METVREANLQPTSALEPRSASEPRDGSTCADPSAGAALPLPPVFGVGVALPPPAPEEPKKERPKKPKKVTRGADGWAVVGGRR